jgi:hypothetical protein
MMHDTLTDPPNAADLPRKETTLRLKLLPILLLPSDLQPSSLCSRLVQDLCVTSRVKSPCEIEQKAKRSLPAD